MLESNIIKSINATKKADKNKIKDLNVLSLFSGCGGMDLGFEGDFEVHAASTNPHIHPNWIKEKTKKDWVKLVPTRFKTVFANDIRQGAKKVWNNFFIKKYNLEENSFHLESIVDRVKRYWEGEKDVFPLNVDVVTGGFPCQDFSVSGKRKGFNSHKSHNDNLLKEDPAEENRGRLYIWMREVIDIIKPKIFIAENVKGLVSLGNVKEIIQNDFREIGDTGYIVLNGEVLHSAHYGVPQSRERVFFVGFRKGLLKQKAIEAFSKEDIPKEYLPFPKTTHYLSKKESKDNTLMPFVALKKVFKDLKEPEQTKDQDQKHFSKAKWYGKHCQGNKEIDLNKIAPTIRAEHHGNIEFRRLSKAHGGKILKELDKGFLERRLTIRECCRIQTFPDNYKFIGEISTSEAYKLLGNATPPLLAYHLAKRLEEIWPLIFKK